MKRRVVITGVGAITPTGHTAQDFWKNCKAGVRGIAPITAFDADGFKCALAAEVKDFDPKAHFDRKQVKRLDRFTQFAMVAAREAYTQANEQSVHVLEPERTGVFLGTGVGGLNTVQAEQEKLLNKGPNFVNPLFVPKWLPNIAAGNIAIDLSIKGQSQAVVTACAAGVHAIGEAFRSIRHGYLDSALAGGAEACITPVMMAGFTNMNAHTTGTDPDRASIPFDKERSGFVLGEGAGFLMLESLEHARQRCAVILAEVMGYGTSTDAYHLTAPEPTGDGAVRAMKMALQDAETTPEQVDYINAHGTSTPQNDQIETWAVKRVFGEKTSTPISSTKSMIGHLQGAAGAVESVACVQALLDDYLPPTLGLTVRDDQCDLDYVDGCGRRASVKVVMKNAFGFGGHNGCLVFGKWVEK